MQPPTDVLRLGVIVPDLTPWIMLYQRLERPGVHAAVSAEPRDVKEWAGQQPPLHLIAIDAALQQPPAAALGQALRRTLGSQTALVLLNHAGAADPCFDAALRPGMALPLLTDRLLRLAAEREQDRRADRTADAADLEVRAEVEIRSLRGAGLSHFEVLDLPVDAPMDAIRRAYDRLSLLLHPDRVRGLRDQALQAQAAALYHQVQQAYQVLRQPGERLRYLQSLRTGAPASGSAPRSGTDADLAMEHWSSDPITRKALRTAQTALQAGDARLAQVQLRFAADREPENLQIQARLALLQKA
jgi:hypothetical protein